MGCVKASGAAGLNLVNSQENKPDGGVTLRTLGVQTAYIRCAPISWLTVRAVRKMNGALVF